MKSYKEPLRGFVVKLKPTEEQIKIFYDYAMLVDSFIINFQVIKINQLFG